jgi:hypothetical protein
MGCNDGLAFAKGAAVTVRAIGEGDRIGGTAFGSILVRRAISLSTLAFILLGRYALVWIV